MRKLFFIPGHIFHSFRAYQMNGEAILVDNIFWLQLFLQKLLKKAEFLLLLPNWMKKDNIRVKGNPTSLKYE